VDIQTKFHHQPLIKNRIHTNHEGTFERPQKSLTNAKKHARMEDLGEEEGCRWAEGEARCTNVHICYIGDKGLELGTYNHMKGKGGLRVKQPKQGL
jgi:hypothetical protein